MTWDWAGRHAAVADRIAAIFNPRFSDGRISELIEFMYDQATLEAGELVYYANRKSKRSYKAQVHPPFIACGHNPSLEARVVTELKVLEDEATGFETISWMEAPLREYNEETRKMEITREPYFKSTTRGITGPLSSVQIWDRMTDSVLPGYEKCEL